MSNSHNVPQVKLSSRSKKLLQKFERKANEWLQDIQRYSEDEIQLKPAPDSWSMAELYDHVMRVSRTYQIPNMKQSLTQDAEQKRSKNYFGLVLFNLNFLPRININMNSFPAALIEKFTPISRDKSELIEDFKRFIDEVLALKSLLAEEHHAHFHPMFGDISTLEWFALIEIHLRHHDKQKKRIKRFIANNNKG